MKILGIDPGLARTGWAIINSRPFSIEEANIITTDSHEPISQRLYILQNELEKVILHYTPDVLVIEKFLVNSNIKKINEKVLQARGIILELAGRYHLDTEEFTPTQVKKAITNSSKSTKKEIIKFIKTYLYSENIKSDIDDVYDAIAVALCHPKIKFPLAL